MTYERQAVVNTVFPMDKLLKKYYGITVDAGSATLHCPFPSHPGNDKRKSAKYFDDSGTMYCFTEQRIYTSYNILRLHGYSDKKLLRAISPYITKVSPLNAPSLNIDSAPFLEQPSRGFKKHKTTVKGLTKPLKQYLLKCRKQLDDANQA